MQKFLGTKEIKIINLAYFAQHFFFLAVCFWQHCLLALASSKIRGTMTPRRLPALLVFSLISSSTSSSSCPSARVQSLLSSVGECKGDAQERAADMLLDQGGNRRGDLSHEDVKVPYTYSYTTRRDIYS